MTPAPLFETDDERIAFVVRLPRQSLATAVDTPQVTPQVGALLSQMDGAMTRQAMQDALGLADRRRFRKS